MSTAREAAIAALENLERIGVFVDLSTFFATGRLATICLRPNERHVLGLLKTQKGYYFSEEAHDKVMVAFRPT